MTGRIRFNEVATREGFQIEPAFVPTDEKVALIDALSGCGDARIEVTSFSFLVMSSSGPRAAGFVVLDLGIALFLSGLVLRLAGA